VSGGGRERSSRPRDGGGGGASDRRGEPEILTPDGGGTGSAAWRAVAAFRAAFGGQPSHLVRSPGRVNLIGEHTDYNGGFCLPVAIDRELWIALRAAPDPPGEGAVELVSEQRAEPAVVPLDGVGAVRLPGWAAYVQGVAVMLTAGCGAGPAAGGPVPLRGWQGALASDIPVGAGLSSSAALELAVARAFACTSGLDWAPTPMARLARRAENDWVGAPTGLLDQLTCAHGVDGHALLVDCRAVTVQPVPLPGRAVVAVLDTGTRRELVTSAYADRRADCERAARLLGVAALRDVGPRLPPAAATALDPVAFRRARHVVSENRRVLDVVAALRAADLAAAGALLMAGHRSIRDDFEASSPALDAMVDAAVVAPGCYGARMTGGGFAGCAVALVDRPEFERFTAAVTRAYRETGGRRPTVYACSAVAGTSAGGWTARRLR
jgi:galactokinase